MTTKHTTETTCDGCGQPIDRENAEMALTLDVYQAFPDFGTTANTVDFHHWRCLTAWVVRNHGPDVFGSLETGWNKAGDEAACAETAQELTDLSPDPIQFAVFLRSISIAHFTLLMRTVQAMEEQTREHATPYPADLWKTQG